MGILRLTIITILMVISTLHLNAQQNDVLKNKIEDKPTLAGTISTATSSDGSTGRQCGTDQALQNRLQDPDYAKYREKIIQKISKSKMKSIPCNAQNSVVIPVAVHFDNSYNCDNTQCLIDATTAQIQSLNDDFAAANADLVKYNEILANCGGTNVASDGVCVTFCLATENHPAGVGISEGLPAITIGTYSGGFGSGGNGASEWVGYLNMFVVDGLGYGVADGIPGALNGDGVTQDGAFWGGPNFTACSSGGALDDDNNWDLGRTLTHEVGHYLGLYHTFQGGCSDEPNSPYDVNDTPAQSDSSSGCVASNNCNALATGCTGGQEVQFNYMDYFDDACLVMFSNEQAIAMNAFVNSVNWAQATTACANGSETALAECGGEVPTCSDGIQNGNEIGIDCGGSCPNECPEPTCDDGIQNGNEEGVDCGGSCPNECPAEPTCDDGIQNGDEEGIDCGGSCASLCPCDGNPVAVIINLDNYPGETDWTITNESGVSVASGGTYDSEPAGSTVTESLCLADGCYTFTINDSYGDGICCGFGTGSYSVTDADGNTLASGGEFANTEATDFCVEDAGGGCSDEGIPCDDDDVCTTGETYDADCNCVGGIFQDADDDDVCDAQDACPGLDDDLIGTPCDDEDSCTTNDMYDSDCNCTGTIQDTDGDGVCDAEDVCPDLDDDLVGTACDDGNDCTTGETYNTDCECTGGIEEDSDGDGVCDAEDICPNLDDNLVGTVCDDGDDCTTGDMYDSDCNCAGTIQDTDGDGVCDAEDVCPDLDDDLAGTACDDGNDCTTGETYNTDCECTGGIEEDSDGDGVCDAEDDCPNDETDSCNVDYCDAQGTNTNYEFIESVELNGQTNISGNDGGYGDYTATTLATLSGTNTVTLTPGFVSSPYAENWSIWIDFNKDGDFDDAGEQVYTGTSSSTTPLTGTFGAPSGTGTTTMRIVMEWNSTPEPCGSFTYGEVEDYIVEFETLCTPNTACDDGDACTEGETYDADCNCTGGTLLDTDEDGVCDANDVCPGLDDALIGMPCDDGDACTEGETYDADCECGGGTLVDTDGDGVCDLDDACPDLDDALIGMPCDDEDPCTEGETYDADCECTGGISQDTDEDGVCDANDVCPGLDDALIGTACDDGDACTEGETYDADCECGGGTLVDTDGDGVCDLDDACPGVDDALIGMPCDDEDACTEGETYDDDCECTGGISQDTDEDGVCDAEDICPGGDDNIDNNDNGIPDDCDTDGVQPTAPCVNGFAGNYPCNDVDLYGFMSLGDMGCNEANDIWGWTDPQTGKEYAIFGCTNGTTFIDISTPTNPILIGSLSTNTTASSWRDMKVYDNHAFIVSEASGHGMQVFDLTRLRNVNNPPANFNADVVLTNLGGGLTLSNSHNIVLNEASGYVYTVGSNTCSGGLTVINVNNPTAPTFEACFSSDGYTHDAQCVDYIGPDGQHAGKEICFNSNENTLTIVDVSDKSDMTQISRTGYAGQRYTHQGWLTDDHEYFLMNDELDETQNGHNTRTHIWDVRNLDSPTYLGFYEAAVASIDHNLYIKGDLAYLANYRSGLRILDISNVENADLEEIAYFDTYPANDNASFNSAWSNYPYFESGYIIISDIEQGLFIVKYNPDDDDGGCDDADGDGLCDEDDPCPNDETNTCDDSAPTYCDASANNSTYEYIQQVIFGNIDNASGNNGGYGDFTAQVANVGLGDAVPFGLTPGFPNSTYNEAWAIWIDYNRDGDFDDAGEEVYSGTSSGTLSGNISIPNSVSIGLTGMRIAMQWNNPASSCGSFTYGEVEDYTVNITSAPQNYTIVVPRNEDQLVASPSMRIQPNPATDFISIGFQNMRDNGMLQIYDLTGKPISQQTLALDSNDLRVEVGHLPAGMYIIRLQFGDNTYATKRFVKLSE